MSRMFALGGGSFQRMETYWMDTKMLHCCEKPFPKVLFLPTATRDDQGYAKRFKRYMKDLGADIAVLRLFHTKLTQEQIREQLLAADILYLGGGNLRTLKEGCSFYHVKEILQEFLMRKDSILCGISAGASLLFDYGYSDCLENGSFIMEEGFHFVKGIFNPHAQKEERAGAGVLAESYALPLYSCKDGEMLMIEDGRCRLLRNSSFPSFEETIIGNASTKE